MEHEPCKHINIDLIKMQLIFILAHDVMVDFSKSLFISNNSPSFEMKVLHSIPIGPCMVNISGVKLAFSTFKIVLLF